jgi:CTP synthase (UTP-ammonia lyase)
LKFDVNYLPVLRLQAIVLLFKVVPHITDAIQEWVERVSEIPVSSDEKKPEVCIIELGGTVGDIEGMAFVEAFRYTGQNVEARPKMQ